MPLQDTLDTYSYFISEADKLNLSYFAFVRYQPMFDIEIDGAFYLFININNNQYIIILILFLSKVFIAPLNTMSLNHTGLTSRTPSSSSTRVSVSRKEMSSSLRARSMPSQLDSTSSPMPTLWSASSMESLLTTVQTSLTFKARVHQEITALDIPIILLLSINYSDYVCRPSRFSTFRMYSDLVLHQHA